MENSLFLGVPILKHIRVAYSYDLRLCMKSGFASQDENSGDADEKESNNKDKGRWLLGLYQ